MSPFTSAHIREGRYVYYLPYEQAAQSLPLMLPVMLPKELTKDRSKPSAHVASRRADFWGPHENKIELYFE